MTYTPDIDVTSRHNLENDTSEDTNQLFLKDCFAGSSDLKKTNPSNDAGLQHLCFFGDEPADKQISDETVKDYIKSFQNLKDNGAANQETLDAFKKSVKGLQDLDAKTLEKELDKAAKNPKVEMMLVAQHLKEVLESSGFKKISTDLQRKEGGLLMKHDASETYISLQYNSNRGKEGAQVSIEKKR